jgi:hypothetical protein
MDLHRDAEFATAKDLLLSEISAKKKFLNFLEEQIEDLDHPAAIKVGLKDLQWTASKAALTELVYAMHLSGCLNHGRINLKQVVQYFEKIFSIDLGDYHHTFLRLRDRSNPSKFIDSLKSSLLERMEELDS